MYEKVNMYHPDKVADRIAGAIVDYAYTLEENPKVAVEVLIGHGNCHIIVESDCTFEEKTINNIVSRIAGADIKVDLQVVPQDPHLAHNQDKEIRCGDNGIFKGVYPNDEELTLVELNKVLSDTFKSDGKYILDDENKRLIICQSNATESEIVKALSLVNGYERCLGRYIVSINPLGEWTGGTNVDTGATNRKLGSDMGRAVTGGGIHGKDLSKADVSMNIFAYICSFIDEDEINISCAIGDGSVKINHRTVSYEDIVNIARDYIKYVGGFEKLAEEGLLNGAMDFSIIRAAKKLIMH